MGIIDKLKDINEMRKQAKHMESLLATETVTGKSSGGKIVLVIDRSALEDVFKQDKKMLQSKFGNMMSK
jgi:hypothetical protein